MNKNKQTKEKQTHRYREQTDNWQRGGRPGVLDKIGDGIKKKKNFTDADNSLVITRGRRRGAGRKG